MPNVFFLQISIIMLDFSHTTDTDTDTDTQTDTDTEKCALVPRNYRVLGLSVFPKSGPNFNYVMRNWNNGRGSYEVAKDESRFWYIFLLMWSERTSQIDCLGRMFRGYVEYGWSHMQQCREAAKRPKTMRTFSVQGQSFPKLCQSNSARALLTTDQPSSAAKKHRNTIMRSCYTTHCYDIVADESIWHWEIWSDRIRPFCLTTFGIIRFK